MAEMRKGESSGGFEERIPVLASLKPLLFVSAYASPPEPALVPAGAQAAKGVTAEALATASLIGALPAAAAGAALLAGPVGWALFGVTGAGAAAASIWGRAGKESPSVDTSSAEKATRDMFGAAAGLSIVSLVGATRCGAKFPPGHPLPGRWYRAHPLPDRAGEYIPLVAYDAALYAEREAELLRLLVDLGATRIAITESERQGGGTEAGAKLDAGSVGRVDAKVAVKDQLSSRDARVFELRGRPWGDVHASGEAGYHWLAFEPAWRSLLHARKIGGCIRASIEMVRDASFSIAAEVGLSGDALAAIGVPGFSAKVGHEGSRSSSYQFEVEFGPSE
jgi:hypothetical protein